MDNLTQSSPALQTPASNYSGYFKGTMTIYHCFPETTRERLLEHVHAWLEAELGERPKVFTRISIGGKVAKQIIPRERFEDVTMRMPADLYDSDVKKAAINIDGRAVLLAEHLLGGRERPYPLLAVLNGVTKDIIVSMPKYAKAPPLVKKEEGANEDDEVKSENAEVKTENVKMEEGETPVKTEDEKGMPDTEGQRLHSADASHVDWTKCLLSLQVAGLVRAEPSAVWGKVQRREEWAEMPPPTMEHEIRMLFLGLHEDLLRIVERFRLSLPVGSDEGVAANGAVGSGASEGKKDGGL